MGREGILLNSAGRPASATPLPCIDALLDKKGNFGLRQFFARISQQLPMCMCLYVCVVCVCADVAATFNEH